MSEEQNEVVAEVDVVDEAVRIMVERVAGGRTHAQAYRNLAYALTGVKAEVSRSAEAARRVRYRDHYRRVATEAEARAVEMESGEGK